jgi:hypothetical protein
MTGLLVIRRVHLYLGLFLLPWVIVFGISSLPLNHTSLQRPVTWTPRATVPFQMDLPADADLRALGRQILDAAGLGPGGGFNVSRPNPRQVTVNRPRFFGFTRVIYRADQQQLTVEDRVAEWPQFLGAMHTRAGFYLGSFGNIAWAVMVDVLCVGLLIWIATGVYMWWHLPASRWWGWLAIASGLACVAVIVMSL